MSHKESKHERDPYNKNQHERGAKLDADKNRLGLVLGSFANALIEVGWIGTEGAAKYTDNGWLDVADGINRYNDAKFRHSFEELAGTKFDSDTHRLHAAHEAWNALARLELIIRQDKAKQEQPEQPEQPEQQRQQGIFNDPESARRIAVTHAIEPPIELYGWHISMFRGAATLHGLAKGHPDFADGNLVILFGNGVIDKDTRILTRPKGRRYLLREVDEKYEAAFPDAYNRLCKVLGENHG